MNFRRLLGPSAIVLALGLAFASAQNITKSVQLSQDGTGLVGYDTVNGVYFPGHILSTTNGSPAPSITATCGTSGQTITGTDFAGTVTVGSSVTTSCPITFGQVYNTAPTCVVATMTGILASLSWVTTVTGLTVTQASTANNKIAYVCSSLK